MELSVLYAESHFAGQCLEGIINKQALIIKKYLKKKALFFNEDESNENITYFAANIQFPNLNSVVCDSSMYFLLFFLYIIIHHTLCIFIQPDPIYSVMYYKIDFISDFMESII